MLEVVSTFIGKWKEESAENFDEFMKILDVNFVRRKFGEHTKASEEWSVDGNKITLKNSSAFKNQTLNFELGQEIDEHTPEGRDVKTTFTEENGKLVQRQHGMPYNCVFTRELQGSLLVLTMLCEAPTPVTAVKKFKRV